MDTRYSLQAEAQGEVLRRHPWSSKNRPWSAEYGR